jgi:hypothetical protein
MTMYVPPPCWIDPIELRFTISGASVDLLARAMERVRPYLDHSLPISKRARNFWAAAVAARDLGASDVVRADLLDLARDTGLTRDLAGGAETVDHLIRWAFLDRNPFF